jgi:predicted nuclease with TOPRIM domain
MLSLPDWLTTLLSSIVTGALTYIYAVRRENSDLRAQEIAQLKELFTTWQDAFEKLKKEKTELEETVAELKQRVFALEKENHHLILKHKTNEDTSRNDS